MIADHNQPHADEVARELGNERAIAELGRAQSWGKTRGQETVWGAVGYQISLSASDSSGGAGSARRGVTASSGRKLGRGTASSWQGREAADPIVIPYLLLDVSGGKIKTAMEEIQERFRNFLREVS